jgi:hypothetical protein
MLLLLLALAAGLAAAVVIGELAEAAWLSGSLAAIHTVAALLLLLLMLGSCTGLHQPGVTRWLPNSSTSTNIAQVSCKGECTHTHSANKRRNMQGRTFTCIIAQSAKQSTNS